MFDVYCVLYEIIVKCTNWFSEKIVNWQWAHLKVPNTRVPSLVKFQSCVNHKKIALGRWVEWTRSLLSSLMSLCIICHHGWEHGLVRKGGPGVHTQLEGMVGGDFFTEKTEKIMNHKIRCKRMKIERKTGSVSFHQYFHQYMAVVVDCEKELFIDNCCPRPGWVRRQVQDC